MNLRVAHPLRSLQRVGHANVGIEILGSHPSQNARRTPTTLRHPWPRVRLSKKKRSLSAPSYRLWLRTGAPRSPQRTWAEYDGAKPPRSLSVRLAEETVPVHASSDEQPSESIRNKSFSAQVPRIPVEVSFVDKLHAAFLKESRTRCRRVAPRSRKSGTLGRTWGTRPCLIGLPVSSHAGRQRRWSTLRKAA
jgi:hypothetical protein